jgi:MFS family permease
VSEGDGGKLRESARAFGAVLRNPNLRRIQLGWAGSNLGTWAYGVALAVYAYGEGGAAAVGLVGLMRWLPSAVAAPFMGVIADRQPRRRVMIASDLVRAVVISGAAVAILADAGAAVVYILVAVGTVVSTAFRPAQAALVPKLATTPLELTASNVVSSTIESAGIFLGPAIAGVLLLFMSEIALLHDVPRQAAAVALDDVELFSLERDEFVGAVTGHAASMEAASAGIGSYGLGGQFAF